MALRMFFSITFHSKPIETLLIRLYVVLTYFCDILSNKDNNCQLFQYCSIPYNKNNTIYAFIDVLVYDMV